MSMTDPIADFLTRIRNAVRTNKRWVGIPSSNMKKRIAYVLKEEKYIKDFFFIKNDEFVTIRIFLKYDLNGKSVIECIDRSSKPGQRIYVGGGDIPRVLDGLGISVLSTSKGVISNKTANKLGVGGELLCEVF